MSTVTTTVVPCPALQDAINTYFMTCHMTPPPMSVVPFLLSPENSSGIRQVVNPSPNKKRTVQLIYDQQIPVSEVNEVAACDLTCTATTERGNLSEDYTIDCTDGLEVEEKITLTDWIESCRNNGELIYSRILSLMNTLARAINQKTVGELNGLIGDWDTSVAGLGTIDANGFLNLPTLVTGGTTPNPLTSVTIDTAKQMTEFCNSTVMFGGLDWYTYMRLIQSGCCTATGVDLRDLFDRFGQAVLFDKDFNSTFGADTAVILQLGSAQLLTLNYAMAMDVPTFTEANWAAAANYYSTVVIHPASGLPMDLTIKNDCGVIHIILRATTKAVALPNDLYAAGESMEGVNWITGLVAVNS